MKKGIIIGGGIGGLTTAIALLQKGFDVTVYEQSSEIREVGAGIWVAPNGLKIFERLGIAEEIAAAGRALEKISVVDPDYRPISTIDAARVRKKHKYATVAIHRAALQKILAAHVPPEKIVLGKKFASYRQTADSIVAEFADGSAAEADFLVAAEGIKSKARETIAPASAELRYSGQTCWRFVTEFELPPETENEMFEIWGDRSGLRAAYSKINERQVYAYVTDCRAAGGGDDKATIKNDLLKLCADFPPVVKKLIESCDPQTIIRTDLYDFKPITNWIDGRLVLIGDAAHATTPNLGQGACQAIEDACVLAEQMSQNESLDAAFQAFQSKRIGKATFITNTSWQFAQLTNASGFKKSVIKRVMRLMPDFISDRQLDKIYSLDY